MRLACLDLEGVLVPEIWIRVAEETGLDELRLTTRDISNYDELMGHRLRVLEANNLTLPEIQEVIASISPLPGAPDFVDWLRQSFQVIILSDTFYQFAAPLMAQLGHPTLFAHDLVISDDKISGYRLRMADQKRHAVQALQNLNFTVIAAGDSYNDTSMLGQAEAGILFCPPDNVVAEFPQFPVARNYQELRQEFVAADQRIG